MSTGVNAHLTLAGCCSSLSVGLSKLFARKTNFWSLASRMDISSLNVSWGETSLHYAINLVHFFTCWFYTLSFFLTELLYSSNAPNLYSQWHGIHTFSIWVSTNIQNWFPCCPAKTCATEKALAARPRRFEENECFIIYAPLTNFMMPLGGHAVVLCLLLLAVVHRCILMDTSKKEVSFWPCSKEPVSQAQWN